MDGTQECSRILLNFFSDEVQVILMCGNLENLRKTFFIRKKSYFNFQKVGVFWSKKRFADFSQNFVRRSSGDMNVPHFVFCNFMSLSEKKSDLKLKKMEILVHIFYRAKNGPF